jgi:hypothetical protein
MRRAVVLTIGTVLAIAVLGVALTAVLAGWGGGHAASPVSPPRKVSGPHYAGHSLALPAAERSGFWRKVELSPDLRWWLGQWSGECEAQSAWLIPAGGGKPRSILPASVESYALGWSGMRARIRVPRAVCGTDGRVEPGIYLVAPDTLNRSLVRRIKSRPGGP